jgi:hypothetical protein
MTAPPLVLACCRCGKRLPRARDVYALDDEWARRYPAMTGRLACHGCALGDRWACGAPGGGFAAGHIPSQFTRAGGRDIDSWSHVSPPHTLRAAARAWPDSAVAQGGETYVRWLVRRWGGGDPADPAAALRALQAEWSR